MRELNFHAGKSIWAGEPTGHIGVRGTDLGWLFVGNKGQWVGGLFGDTFNGWPSDGGWRSPVMMRSSNRDFNTRGIVWDNAVNRGWKFLDYPQGITNGDPRRRDQGCVTIIPNDAIQLPDGHYMGMGFRVREWNSGPNNDMGYTHSATWFHATDEHAENWSFVPDLEAPGEPGFQWWNRDRDRNFQNTTFLMVPGDDNVYVFGTPEGRDKGAGAGIYLKRCHWQHLWQRSWWEYWGWDGRRWVWDRNIWPGRILQPTVPGSSLGEINAHFIAGKVRLTYFDGPLGAVCRTADRPDGGWGAPAVMLPNGVPDYPYAAALHPWSDSDSKATITASSWPHGKGDPEKGTGPWVNAYGAYTYGDVDIRPGRVNPGNGLPSVQLPTSGPMSPEGLAKIRSKSNPADQIRVAMDEFLRANGGR